MAVIGFLCISKAGIEPASSRSEPSALPTSFFEPIRRPGSNRRPLGESRALYQRASAELHGRWIVSSRHFLDRLPDVMTNPRGLGRGDERFDVHIDTIQLRGLP